MTTAGAANGKKRSHSGRRSVSGPSHHGAMPATLQAYQTAPKAATTATQPPTKTVFHLGVNWPGFNSGGDHPPATMGSAGRSATMGSGAKGSAAFWDSVASISEQRNRAFAEPVSWALAPLTTEPVPCGCMGQPAFAKLSIFFPMWNEKDYIERALNAGGAACDDLLAAGEIADYELIVVDDASTDDTADLADQFAAANPRIRVVHHRVNRKLGGSIKTGFATATGDLVLYTDADLPFDFAELSKAIRLMRLYESDIVSAYRHDRTEEGSSRAIYTFFYNLLIRVMFGVKMRDINFAFKLCKRHIFDHIELHSEGSFIDAELVIRAKKLGFTVTQFGVDYFPRTRGQSTLSSPAIIIKILREMFELRAELQSITKVV